MNFDGLLRNIFLPIFEVCLRVPLSTYEYLGTGSWFSEGSLVEGLHPRRCGIEVSTKVADDDAHRLLCTRTSI